MWQNYARVSKITMQKIFFKITNNSEAKETQSGYNTKK